MVVDQEGVEIFMGLSPGISETSRVLLVAVRSVFYGPHTFTFRLPLIRPHRATNLS